MKLLILGISSILSLNAFSMFKAPVNVRSSERKIETVTTEFPFALAETDEFKVLNGTDQHAVDFSSKDLAADDRLRAATVLYHLQIARDYFVNELGSDYVKNFPQMNVRINMSKPFNEYYHFLKDSKKDDYNNAVTIPASNSKAMPDVNPWQMEIWFRPPKAVEIDNVVYQTSKQVLNANLGSTVAGNVANLEVQQSVTDSALFGTLDTVDYMGVIGRLAYTYGILDVLPRVFMWATKPIKTDAYLDASMIPEVAYHEFSHAALSDYISIRRSTPLNEGVANYFAAVMLGNSKIADKMGKYSKSMTAYDGKAKKKYSSLLETSSAAHASFVFSFLWSLRERMGKEFENGEKIADKLIFASRKYVTYSGKPIKDDLMSALVNATVDAFESGEARKARMIIKDHALKTGI